MKVKILKHYGTVRCVAGVQGRSEIEDKMNSYFKFNYMAQFDDDIIDYYSEDSINHDLRKVGEEFYV